ncbi:Phosphotransferase enzyme family protein [compost metagenome]
MNMEKSNDYQEVKRELYARAAQHGLHLNTEAFEVNESGLDFFVAFVRDNNGQAWVLRKPRRSDVWERALNERNVLKAVAPRISVAVPDWRICTPDLIAYPLLAGNPVATVDPAGSGYVWRFPQEALGDTFYDSLAETLAALHCVDHDEAMRSGVRRKTPAETREAFAANIEEVRQNFDIPAKLLDRWMSWLTTDSYWPEFSVLHHGDLHPPHILVDDNQRMTGLIDWTEAEIADPGKDFVILYALFGEKGLQDILNRYERRGGRTWYRMKEHIAEQWAAYPALVAKFALTTRKEDDMNMARGMINSWNID